MSRNRNRTRETMAADPTPDPGGVEFPTLVADIDVDQNAWRSAGNNLEGLCQNFAVAAFNQSQQLKSFVEKRFESAELAMRLTTDTELQNLNFQFRGLAKPTNVLSFAALDGDGPALLDGSPLFLGDIAIAAETVIREARDQQKTIQDHLAHMVVHGTLHLLGYDHEEEADAQEMESLERDILKAAGISDPYQAQELAS